MIPPSRAPGPREYLASLEQFGIKLGLTTITALCERLGRPDRAFPSLLIAGTNGKGSTAAFVDEALRAAGYRTGRYTSPHLIRLEERFHVDGRPVDAASLDGALEEVRAAAEQLRAEGTIETYPTYFEAVTGAAFSLFARARVDAAVLEVGLGGRYDATNVVTPLAAAITSIAYDHERYLGSTLAAIAGEKAGIIKPGVPTVIGRLPPDARSVVAETCARQHAPLIDAWEDVTAEPSGGNHEVVRLQTPSFNYGEVRLALRGRHQIDNAVVAVRLLEIVRVNGRAVPPEAIRTGLERAIWPGRLDLRRLADGRRVLIDGAHNPDGARAFAAYVSQSYGGTAPVVFGAMRDKDLRGMMAALAPVSRPLVLTTAPGVRAASVDMLLAAAREAGVEAVGEPDLTRALERAWSAAPDIAVAGSLYLAGAILEWLERTESG
ncbi:MAG TPA: folylpolyglutamate synthase/dihydrofolate synthase family protein [Vicinamibacterales bacterium]|nr:folylpolyglutamate synthase/dihydrofolate synthase family protein [Vicinamibacterales bacterium]